MQRLVLVLSALFALFSLASTLTSRPASAANGEDLFNSLHCSACHKPQEKSVAVSLAQIAKTYGDQEKLIEFFKGEAKPKIETDKAGMMRGQMPKLKALSDQEKQALAHYIFSFK